MISILFVCRANLCRSVALQGFLQRLVDQKQLTHHYFIDSSGTDPAIGSDGDVLTRIAAAKRGVVLKHTPRRFEIEDFLVFDYIIPVSKEILEDIISLAPTGDLKKKVYLATHFSRQYTGKNMEDPYFEGGVEGMLDFAEEIAEGIVNYLEHRKI